MLRVLVFVGLALAALPLGVWAQTEGEKQAPEFRGQAAQRIAAWLKVSQDHAADYRLAPQDDPESPLKLLPDAVFRHSQPVRGDDIGAVYLWVDKAGLPAALGTVFAFSYGGAGERWVAHEFHSLARKPLVGKWRGAEAWSPAEPGLTWQEVPEAPAPSSSASGRLRQMRDIGRRLTAQSTDGNDSRWELRLITQPIYQYPANEEAGTLGGGVFLFCQGTDPELILVLDARQAGERRAWHYAVAPFTDYALTVALDGKEVWSLEKGHRPTRSSAHWWNGKMEVKKLSDAEEAELAEAFNSRKKTE
jgi:hypothetical protein